MKVSKRQYFQAQLDNATKNKMTEKADYYRRRITEVVQNNEASQMIDTTKSKMTTPEMLQACIKIWNVRSHSASTRHAFLAGKGIPEAVILQGFAYIGHGKLMSDM